MKRNDVIYFQQKVNGLWSEEKIEECIKTVMDEIGNIYTLLIIVDGASENSYVVRYGISNVENYNTIKEEQVINKVLSSIKENEKEQKKHIIGHIQPDLELMVNLYEPLIQKLATFQKSRWRMLEYDDLCQICRMTLVILYNEGYYIHKNLLEKAFNNAVLQEVRKLSLEINIVSLEEPAEGNEDMEKITLKDTICDISAEHEKQDGESKEISDEIFSEVKNILIEIMGERQFEQLYRDYAKGHTSTWSRRKMQTIKRLFEQEELTRKKFNNKYGRQ